MDAAIFSVTAGVALISTLLFGAAAVHAGGPGGPGPCRHLPGSLAFGSVMSVIASLCAVPAIAELVEQVTRIDNAGRLGAHLCGIGLAVGLRSAMTEWTHGVDSRKNAALLRIAVAGAVAFTASAIFYVANRSSLDFTSSFATDRGVAAYLLVVYLYSLWVGATTAIDAGTLAGANLRSAGHRTLGLGQALLAAGGVACVIYGAAGTAFVAAQQVFGLAWDPGVGENLSSLSSGLFLLCSLSGLAVLALRASHQLPRPPAVLRAEAITAASGRASRALPLTQSARSAPEVPHCATTARPGPA
ncbi:hypothetical protein [Kitasatospora sp. NPDC057223]|uniref:hypothetical protein n=1 Tax=Kitasatospora sp. NPDC057223 TaxID=3346055 RepID=UPI0036394B57